MAVALPQGACTTSLYRGPARPASEVALLTSQDTMIEKIDTLMVRDLDSGSYARFEVLPGPHRVGISLHRVMPSFFMHTLRISPAVVVCVQLKAGHAYRTQAVIQGQGWAPEVVDLNTARAIDPSCPERKAAIAMALRTPAPAPEPMQAPVAASSLDASASRGSMPVTRRRAEIPRVERIPYRRAT